MVNGEVRSGCGYGGATEAGFCWRAGPFLIGNLEPVLEIVSGSTILDENFDMPKYLATVRQDSQLAAGDFTSTCCVSRC